MDEGWIPYRDKNKSVALRVDPFFGNFSRKTIYWVEASYKILFILFPPSQWLIITTRGCGSFDRKTLVLFCFDRAPVAHASLLLKYITSRCYCYRMVERRALDRKVARSIPCRFDEFSFFLLKKLSKLWFYIGTVRPRTVLKYSFGQISNLVT